MPKAIVAGALAGAVLLAATPAFAHITLPDRPVTIGGSFKAVFQVPHGCDGAATTAIRIRIPAGIFEAKPQPKAGWTASVVKGNYDKPFTNRHATITAGVTEVDFTGGNLPDDDYDEFAVHFSIADSAQPGPLYFPIIQECGSAAVRWIDIPEAGKSADDYPHPAPHLELAAPKGGTPVGDGDD